MFFLSVMLQGKKTSAMPMVTAMTANISTAQTMPSKHKSRVSADGYQSNVINIQRISIPNPMQADGNGAVI